jgi:hypothetical protein
LIGKALFATTAQSVPLLTKIVQLQARLLSGNAAIVKSQAA